MSDQLQDVQAKSKDFLDKAKAGTLDEATLNWGLSVGSLIAGASLFFAYYSLEVNAEFAAMFGGMKTSTTGLDLLNFQGGVSFASLKAWSIPLTAILGLYLKFGEPALKIFKMETPGRAQLIYTIGLVMSVLGVIGCIDFLRLQVRVGSILGLLGLGLLAFVFFKLRQLAPAAPAAPAAPPAPPAPPAA